ncbi:DNA-binding response regulator, OmpR family, contains REC and winged-helix (wHTH) domain [Fictibacillus solisalsi]|uniref:DNA-binding response regulator, OmpR family, contains REC and winged-helix (WHTH) domain n=1 Tax=Fictibacillus solisalsi TaxID=459525 RepID=A0A1G9XR44_9BACL|nr:response regulator transcription factor [Fictibacillus solisalsi]SDM99190.1 DNA-binding response regulator, OmpR family, contains REC and winged-helix (wHTH) domain [Fictibacillus solisalsi]
MDPVNILIIEDEKKIARILGLELEFEGYQYDISYDGLEGLAKATKQEWDLILLDVMIPQMSGMEVLRRLRAAKNATPVILLTARDSIPDIVSGLDLGANDYVTKPYQTEELLARIRTALRFKGAKEKSSEDLFTISDLKVNGKSRSVKRGTREIELTRREFDLLSYLVKNKNQVLTRDQILTEVWGFDYYGDTNVVDVYIRYLRKKLGDHEQEDLIHTVRGVGYCIRSSNGEN